MPGAAGVKFKPDIAVQKENSEVDYGPDMQSLGQLLLAMCIREDTEPLECDQRPPISGFRALPVPPMSRCKRFRQGAFNALELSVFGARAAFNARLGLGS